VNDEAEKRARDEPVGVLGAPRLEVPVVVGAQRGPGQLLVLGPHRQALADEPRQERREAHRRPDAVDVHVLDPVVDIPRAAAHVLEPGGLEAVLLAGPAGHGVEADVREDLVEPQPRLATVVGVDDAGLDVGELLREAAFEDVGWLHDVVVDRHDGGPLLPRLRLGQEGVGAAALALTQDVGEILD
jgi:hypothetical protein